VQAILVKTEACVKMSGKDIAAYVVLNSLAQNVLTVSSVKWANEEKLTEQVSE